MLSQISAYIKGEVVVELCGLYPERFFNLCKNRGIRLAQIFYEDKRCFCRLSLPDYRKLRPVVRKSRCMARVKKRIGLPFALRQARQRKGFLFGILLAFFLCWQCSLRIWNIEINGGYLHTKEQLLHYLAKEGILAGRRASEIDCFALEKKMRLAYPDIGWVSAEIAGTNLYINLNESVMPEKAMKKEGYYHIVAQYDGVVKQVAVTAGVPKVKPGDEVKAGDILICGVLPIVGDNDVLLRNEPLAAAGKVILEAEFSYAADYSRYYTERTELDHKRGLAINFFGKKLFSYIPRYSVGKYDIMTIDVIPVKFEEFLLPLDIREYHLYAFEKTQRQYGEEESVARAKEELARFFKDLEGQQVKVISQDISFETTGSVCRARGAFTAQGNFISYEEIAEEEWRTEHEHSGDNP